LNTTEHCFSEKVRLEDGGWKLEAGSYEGYKTAIPLFYPFLGKINDATDYR
jgi:hypothetical protein